MCVFFHSGKGYTRALNMIALVIAGPFLAVGIGITGSTSWHCDDDDSCLGLLPAEVSAAGLQFTTGESTVPWDVPIAASAVEWGVDRIDQRHDTLDRKRARFVKTGEGTTLYIVDTGLNCSVVGGPCTSDQTDYHGHGTGMARLARLVAPNVTLRGVAALGSNGKGSLSRLVQSLLWALEEHRSVPYGPRVSVVLMALSTEALEHPGAWEPETVPSLVLKTLDVMHASGMVTVAAAGNSAVDACSVVPARSSSTVTVAAATEVMSRVDSSNYGNCTSLFAPGTATSSSGSNWVGTSVAAAYVAGASAGAAGGWRATGYAWEVANMMVTTATPVPVSDARGVPEKIVYSPRDGRGKPLVRAGSRAWVYALAVAIVCAGFWL